jgi:hypothetical protein
MITKAQDKKVLVLTGSDESMHSVLDLTIPSKQRYAQKHGYDLLVRRSFRPLPELGYLDNVIGIGFLRTLMVFQMLEHYDIVMWVDGDSIITNENMPVSDFLVGDHSFYASWDWLSHANGGPGYNGFSSGNFIVQRTANSQKLFNTFIQVSKHFLQDEGADQVTLNTIYNTEGLGLRQEFRVLDHKFLNAVPEFMVTTKTWMADPKRSGPTRSHVIVSPWDENCFLAHLTGCTTEDRVVILQTYLKKYL